MTRLIRADLERFVLRRISRYFPLVLLGLIIAGVVIAYFVIADQEGDGPDFVSDIAEGRSASGVLGPLGDLLPVMAFVLGASFIGADLKTGVVEQLLTWEPRRIRFVVSRAVAAFVGVATISMILATLTILLLYGLCAAAGTTDGTSGELWTNAAVAVLRAGVAQGMFAVFGLAVTLLLANSVAAIVGFVIYWFIIEGFLLQAFLPEVAVYLPVVNTSSFATSRDVEYIEGSVFATDGPELVSHHGYQLAGLILLGWVIVFTIAAGAVFSRRDID